MVRFAKTLALGALALSVASGACAATATSNFNVTMTIDSQCAVTNPTTLAFGASGLLTTAVDQTSTFDVTCTNTTPYTVGLDAGANASGAQRRMTGGTSEYINYNLYQDSGHTTAWDNSSSTEAGTGTGAAQLYTVYGEVPAQSTPSPSTYTDTVNITVTY